MKRRACKEGEIHINRERMREKKRERTRLLKRKTDRGIETERNRVIWKGRHKRRDTFRDNGRKSKIKRKRER